MRQKTYNRTKELSGKLPSRLIYSLLNCILSFVILLVVYASDLLINSTITTLQYIVASFVVANFVSFHFALFTEPTNFSWTFERHVKLKKKLSTILKTTLIYCASVPIIHLAAVLFGATAFTHVSETFYFSLLLSVTTVLPGCFLWGFDNQRWLRLIFGPGAETSWEQQWIDVGLGTTAGAWIGAVVIPLDWDRPWQLWPISCIYGTLAGNFVSNAYVLLLNRGVPSADRRGKRV